METANIELRATSHASKHVRGPHRFIIVTVVLVIAFTVVLITWSIKRFGTVSAGLSFISGERLFIDPIAIRTGPLVVGDRRAYRVILHNYSGRSIQILGSETSCTCSVVGNLPERLAAGSSHPLEIRVNASTKIGDLGSSIKIFTNYEPRPIIKLRVSGSIVAKRGTPGTQTQ